MSRKNIIQEAIADAKATREAALENAKSLIVDAFTPGLKGKISENLDEAVIAEGQDQPSGYDSGSPGQNGEDMLNKGDGDAVYEDDDTSEGTDEDVNEDVYEIALAEEEYEDEESEEESEEEEYSEEEVKESGMYEATQVKTYIRQLQKENNAYKKAVKQLQNEFNDVNLFNAKLIYANKVLRTPGLTKNQKYGIVERFDDAGSINEVKIIFKSLTEGVKIGAAVGQKPRARKSSMVVPSVSNGKSQINEEFTRLQQLSGLLKD
tara:strand:+ start:2973 stop:3764 length:792 start_codon:yes stop_codon:yes gene_type:complete